jgi:site-specific recombinase XerC
MYLPKEENTSYPSYEAAADDLYALYLCVLELTERNPGQPITKWTIKDIFDRISDALQIPQLTPHKMRHLMLTELKRSGMELLDVSRYGRHRRISSTEIYLHTDLSDLARQVNHAHDYLERLIGQVEAEQYDEG